MLLVGLLIISFAISSGITAVVRRHAVALHVVDVPNHRSSHTCPTPRGGGLGFSIVFLGSAIFLSLLDPESRRSWMALSLAGVPISLVGWLDDQRNLPSSIRLVVHAVCAWGGVYLLGGMPKLDLGVATLWLGWVGSAFAILATAWSINLYNFMDGLDGLAGAHALMVSLVWGILFYLRADRSLALICWSLSAAIVGFLVWNWPPARIFMGDVGSGLLGFAFAIIALIGGQRGTLPVVVSVMILLPFVVDATATLLRRLYRGEPVMEAHRTHAYQLATTKGWSHRAVTLTVVVLDLILAVLSFVGLKFPHWSLVLLGLEALGLVSLWGWVTRVWSTALVQK